MGFFSKLFGKTDKEGNKPAVKRFEEMTEEEKLHEATLFIKVNAEGDDGDPEYQFQYGVMYATGKGPHGHGTFNKDLEKAQYWLEKSAAQGNTDALCMLGRLHMDDGDSVTAVKYYRMAAEKGNEAACENLAMAYGIGDGVAQDRVEAHKWFLKAANLGSAFAQFIVGRNYFNGDGVEENASEAFKWYRKAAEQGQPNAQFEMGQIYELGQIYEYGGGDVETARKWYVKAAEQGHEEAQRKLQEL